ncbi:MAG: type II secretion system F family protein [Clostridiales bacterium]|jgi:tight adherence protein C|nr:type II secretion system F family protein [Eubacteriales bacterium]MDH7566301.1 type II secretion system F family protein [Clostridiales bacterium]
MQKALYIIFIFQVAGVVILFAASRNRFKEELAFTDRKVNRLKPILPVGFQLLKIFRHKYKTGYEKKLEMKLKDLKGAKYAHTYLKLHIAQKVVVMLLSLVFLTFVGTQVQIDAAYLLFCAALEAALFYAADRQLDNQLKKRARSIQLEFPEFLNKLVLLVNAGLSVLGSIQKIVRDNKKENPLYEELAIAINEINTGKSQIQAYEDFAKRCRQQEITTFVTTLIQNMKRGNDEMVPVLRMLSMNSWENRKLVARRLGEEASTKLILPMMIVFIAILIMVMTPAVLQLNF